MPDTIRTTGVIGDDYVDEAEEIMEALMKGSFKKKMTTTKIRNILSMMNDIYNREFNSKEDKLSDESYALLQRMRVRLVYETGRDKDDIMKKFVEETKLLDLIKNVGRNKNKFLSLARYMEALVAYHRFLGGND